MKRNKKRILSMILAFIVAYSGILPGADMYVRAEANVRTTSTPTSGAFLGESVVAEFDVTDGTYVLSQDGKATSKDVVMATNGDAAYSDYIYIQHDTTKSWNAGGWSRGKGRTKGYMKVVIPANEIPADYDHIRINVKTASTEAFVGTAHVVGTALAADTYDAVTWNTVTAAGALGVAYPISTEANADVAAIDVTDMIKEALAAGRETISIVINPSSGWDIKWYSGRADATQIPVLQFTKGDGTAATPAPTVAPTPKPTPVPTLTPAPTEVPSGKTRVTETPIVGFYVGDYRVNVVSTYTVKDGTFVHSAYPDVNMYTRARAGNQQNQIMAGWFSSRIDSWSNQMKGGKATGILKIDLPEEVLDKTVEWDYARLNLRECEGRAIDSASHKVYLVGDYTVSEITLNTFPAKVEGSPELTASIAGETAGDVVAVNITDLIAYAVEHGINPVNIAIESVSGNVVCSSGRDSTETEDYAPVLQLITIDETAPTPAPTPVPTPTPTPGASNTTTATPNSGDHLYDDVVATYTTTDGTYVFNASGYDSRWRNMYTQGQEPEVKDYIISGTENRKVWGSFRSGTSYGFLNVVIPADEIANLDYDHIRLTLKNVGSGASTHIAHVTGVSAYNTYTTVSWGYVYMDGAVSSMESGKLTQTASIFMEEDTDVISVDVTEMIEEALDADRNVISIVIEAESGCGKWSSGRENADYTPLIQFTKIDPTAPTPTPKPTPVPTPKPTLAPIPEPTPDLGKTRVTETPIVGAYLYDNVVATYPVYEGTFTHSAHPAVNMATRCYQAEYAKYIGAGSTSVRIDSWTATPKGGIVKGILKIYLPAEVMDGTVDWDGARLNMRDIWGSERGLNMQKAYLVGDYGLNSITLNNFPKKVTGTPEVMFDGSTTAANVVSIDITDLVEFAVDKGINQLNIAIERVLGNMKFWSSGRDNTETEDYAPVLQLMKKSDKISATIEGGDRIIPLGDSVALKNKDIESGKAAAYTYTSSDASIVSVTADGVITGVSEGEANITLTIGNVSDTVHVTVEKFVLIPPEFGVYLDHYAVQSYDVTDGTYVSKGLPNGVIRDTDSHYKNNTTINVGTHAIITGNTYHTSNNIGLMKVELDNYVKENNWKYAALDLRQIFNNYGYENIKLKAYLVEDYDGDTVTWNNQPSKVAGTPEVEFFAGGAANKATRCDVTELVRFAVENNLTTMNIALEYLSGSATGINFGTNRTNGFINNAIGRSVAPQLSLLTDNEVIYIPEGDSRYLELENAEGKEYVYSGGAEGIATVTEDGTVKAVGVGVAKITRTAGGKTEDIYIGVLEDNTSEDLLIIKERTIAKLITQKTEDDKYPEFTDAAIDSLSKSAEKIWKNMSLPGERADGRLWDLAADVNDPEGSIYISDTNTSGLIIGHVNNLLTLAQAFNTEGTRLYQDPEVGRALIEAFEYVTNTGRYADLDLPWAYDGEWPAPCDGMFLNVAVPRPLYRAILLMEDYMEQSQLDLYGEIYKTYGIDPFKLTHYDGTWHNDRGANSMDMCQVYLAVALMQKDAQLLNQTRTWLNQVVVIKDHMQLDTLIKCGAYTDGTYIFHHNEPLNFSYGAVTISGTLYFMEVLKDTAYDFTEEQINAYLAFAPEAFLANSYKGMGMSMFFGRNLTQPHYNPGAERSYYIGKMDTLLGVADYAEEKGLTEYADRIRRGVKWNLEGLTAYYGEENAIGSNKYFNDVYYDDSIEAERYLNGIKYYNSGLRLVQANDNYTAGLAMMRRDHIVGYEGAGGYNQRGYYHAAGMLYFYTDELEAYCDEFWCTNDVYRLPGVTADTRELEPNQGQDVWSENKVAGGAHDDEFASMILPYDATYLGLDTRATKSYFFLREGVLQMGTAISGTTDDTIETTIESRLLNDTGNNKILVNGKELKLQKDAKTGLSYDLHMEAGSWIHMEGNVEGADMAWYFPVDTDIYIRKDRVHGDHNLYGGARENKSKYVEWRLKMGIVHGTGTVADEKYLFMTLPGMTPEEVELFAQNNSLEYIDGYVENGNTNAHVIKDYDGTLMAVNYLGTENYKADWLTLDPAEDAVSILVTEDSGVYTLSVADPSYSDSITTITSDYKMNVISKDDRITVSDDGKTLEMDAFRADGKSCQITFTLEGKEATVEWPTTELLEHGKTLADVQLVGGSTTGTFTWAAPETMPGMGMSTHTLVYTDDNGASQTKDIMICVVDTTGSSDDDDDHGHSSSSGSGSAQAPAADGPAAQAPATDALDSVPKTGDSTPVVAIMITLLLSAIAIVAMFFYQKRKKNV